MSNPARFRLRIIHKGLLLVLLPLILQVVLFIQLLSLESKAEKLSAEVERLTARQAVMCSLASSLVDVFQKMLGLATGHPPKEANTETSMKKLENRVLQAKALIQSDNNQSEVDAKLLKLIDTVRQDQVDMILVLEEIQKQSDASAGNPMSQFIFLTKMRSRWFKFGNDMVDFRELLEEQIPTLQKQISENQASREKIRSQLHFGIVAEATLAILLLLLFTTDITKRLAVLVDNARRIPSGQPLTASVSGSDELAYLDSVIHSASTQLREATEHRNSLMQMVAHDLRSPLISIRLALELLLKPQDETARENRVISINRNVGRLILLIEDLLTIEKLESGKLDLNLDAVSLKALTDEAFETIAARAQAKNITLKNEAKTALIAADPDRLMQVITNLVSNAITYSPKDTSVTVITEARPEEIIVSIVDQGPGISQEMQESLFQKFQRTSTSAGTEGFGLGLAICKLIVAAHGGQIGVTSTEGKGSTFWFTLPIEPPV